MRVWTLPLAAALVAAGGTVGYLRGMAFEPALVVQTEWRTPTTAPLSCPDLGHTSLNPDELRTLLTIMQTTTTTTTTRIVLPPSTLPPSSTTSTTVPPSTTTTVESTTTTEGQTDAEPQ